MKQSRLQRVVSQITVAVGLGDRDHIGQPATAFYHIDLTTGLFDERNSGRLADITARCVKFQRLGQNLQLLAHPGLFLIGNFVGLLDDLLAQEFGDMNAVGHQILGAGPTMNDLDMGLVAMRHGSGMGKHIVALAVAANRNQYLAYHVGTLSLKQTVDQTVRVDPDIFG